MKPSDTEKGGNGEFVENHMTWELRNPGTRRRGEEPGKGEEGYGGR